MNTRNRLYYKRQKIDNESEKDVVTKDIISVTSVVEKVRKEIRLCDEVYDNVPMMNKQIREKENKENKKSKQKEEIKLKKKKDKGDTI